MPSVEGRVPTPEGVLRMETQIIEVPYTFEPSKSWTFTDKAEHKHYRSTDPGTPYPTLKEVVDREGYCADCRDDHTDSHLECRECGETIQPGMSGPGIERIPGMTTYYLDDEPISPERFMDLWNEHVPGPGVS